MNRPVESHLWTLDELERRVANALSVAYPGQDNRQVRDVPNLRTIRYYTTLGLIDRPSGWRGRTALYGEKHLLQLVAIKKLQVQRKSLVEIQTAMAGLSDDGLRQIASVPESLAGSGTAAHHAAEPPERPLDFWRCVPDEPVQADGMDIPATRRMDEGRTLQAISLEPGVTLLVAAERKPSADDVALIRHAARPVLQTLAHLGFVLTCLETGEDS
jgi:DNA-binding transcriptional MerR regulator